MTTPTPNEQHLIPVADELGLDARDLDELVYECHSSEASNINNEGLTSQIDYLVPDFFDTKTFEQMLREIATEKI